MWRRFYSIRRDVWLLTAVVAVFAIVSAWLRTTGAAAPQVFLYGIQPFGALAIAGLAYYLGRGAGDRARRQIEKAYMVGSVIAVWFVVYFLSGLALTYVHNTLFASPLAILLNVFGYGASAIALEYSRHTLMMLAGRRNVVWFGLIVAVVFGLQQMSFLAISNGFSADQFLKFFVADAVPVITSSLVLTYLAISSGLPAQLVYRLGILATTLLVPILPKLDWYLIGVSSVLLALAVYLVIDRAQQGRKAEHRHHHVHIARAGNAMFIIVMIALILFMTGGLSYKPVVVVSDSMKPVYSRGSVIVVRLGYNPMDIEVGDIIQYKHKQDGKVITHRVIAIDQAGDGSGERVFITKGDNNQSQDIPVESSQVTGVVQGTVPYVGYPTIWLRTLAP